MMPQIKKILYAADLSANSGVVLRQAVLMAKNYGAKISVLHVLEQSPASITALAEVYLTMEQVKEVTEGKYGYARETLESRIREFCQKELAEDPGAMEIFDAIHVVEGFPADQLLRKSKAFNCDVIVMGTHGKGSLMHSYFGSTAKRVIRRSHLPVFVVPLPKSESVNTQDDQGGNGRCSSHTLT